MASAQNGPPAATQNRRWYGQQTEPPLVEGGLLVMRIQIAFICLPFNANSMRAACPIRRPQAGYFCDGAPVQWWCGSHSCQPGQYAQGH